MKTTFSNYFNIAKGAAISWSDHDAPKLSAALSYYTVFSLAPLLLVATGVVEILFDSAVARQTLFNQLSMLVGQSSVDAIQTIVIASQPEAKEGILQSIVGVAVLLFGASGVFVELRNSLNIIWGVKPKKESEILAFLRKRLISFAMVLSIGFLLLVSLIATSLVAALSKYLDGFLGAPGWVYQLATSVTSFGVTTLLFAMIFKILPDTRVEWRAVWAASVVTALLFNLGRLLIGLYLGKTATASAFGASAAVVLILVWAYYSSFILLYGAEFTKAYSDRFGLTKNPSPLGDPSVSESARSLA